MNRNDLITTSTLSPQSSSGVVDDLVTDSTGIPGVGATSTTTTTTRMVSSSLEDAIAATTNVTIPQGLQQRPQQQPRHSRLDGVDDDRWQIRLVTSNTSALRSFSMPSLMEPTMISPVAPLSSWLNRRRRSREESGGGEKEKGRNDTGEEELKRRSSSSSSSSASLATPKPLVMDINALGSDTVAAEAATITATTTTVMTTPPPPPTTTMALDSRNALIVDAQQRSSQRHSTRATKRKKKSMLQLGEITTTTHSADDDDDDTNHDKPTSSNSYTTDHHISGMRDLTTPMPIPSTSRLSRSAPSSTTTTTTTNTAAAAAEMIAAVPPPPLAMAPTDVLPTTTNSNNNTEDGGTIMGAPRRTTTRIRPARQRNTTDVVGSGSRGDRVTPNTEDERFGIVGGGGDGMVEVDFYRNPTMLSRLVLNQKYPSSLRRLRQHPTEAATWVVSASPRASDQSSTNTPSTNIPSTTSTSPKYTIRLLPIHIACQNLCRTHDSILRQQLNELIAALVVSYPPGAYAPDHQQRVPVVMALFHNASVDTMSVFFMANPTAVTTFRDPVTGLSLQQIHQQNRYHPWNQQHQQQHRKRRSPRLGVGGSPVGMTAAASTTTSTPATSERGKVLSSSSSSYEAIQKLLHMGTEFWKRAREEAQLRLCAAGNRSIRLQSHPDPRRKDKQDGDGNENEEDDPIVLLEGDFHPAVQHTIPSTLPSVASDQPVASGEPETDTIISLGDEDDCDEEQKDNDSHDGTKKRKDNDDFHRPAPTNSNAFHWTDGNANTTTKKVVVPSTMAWKQLEDRAIALEQILTEVNLINFELNQRLSQQQQQQRQFTMDPHRRELELENMELAEKLQQMQRLLKGTMRWPRSTNVNTTDDDDDDDEMEQKFRSVLSSLPDRNIPMDVNELAAQFKELYAAYRDQKEHIQFLQTAYLQLQQAAALDALDSSLSCFTMEESTLTFSGILSKESRVVKSRRTTPGGDSKVTASRSIRHEEVVWVPDHIDLDASQDISEATSGRALAAKNRVELDDDSLSVIFRVAMEGNNQVVVQSPKRLSGKAKLPVRRRRSLHRTTGTATPRAANSTKALASNSNLGDILREAQDLGVLLQELEQREEERIAARRQRAGEATAMLFPGAEPAGTTNEASQPPVTELIIPTDFLYSLGTESTSAQSRISQVMMVENDSDFGSL